MRLTDIYLSGIGVFLPETVPIESAVENGLYAAEEVKQHEWTGLAVAGEIPAPEMALRAARSAFTRCGRDPESTNLLLYTDCWHQGPDGWQPQFYLQHYLVGGELVAVELRNGCNAVFSALELAGAYLTAGQREVALIAAGDNFGTPLVDRWNPGPGFIAGDGAGALVVTRERGFAQVLSVNSTTITAAEEIHRCGEPMFPPGATIGRSVDFTARAEKFRKKQMAEGTAMALATEFQRRPAECVDRTLQEAGITVGDLTRVVLTHTSKEEAEIQFMAVLGLPLEVSTWEFGSGVGHLASADHIVALDHLLSTGQLAPGDHVLLIGAAPGLTYSCAVLRILDLPSWTAEGSQQR
jgi:3-oxoacyl-[acyl-carrier-protein] synthase-3